MKTTLLYIGAILFLLSTMPLNAQKISEKQKKSTTEKNQKNKISTNTRNTVQATIISPRNKTRVTSPLTVKGTSSKNGQVEVSVEAIYADGSQDLGTFKVTANSKKKWSTAPINLWVPENAKNVKFQISAIQIVKNKKSKAKKITVLPLQKVRIVPRAKIKGGVIKRINPTVMSPIDRQKVVLKKSKINSGILESLAPPRITSPKNQTVITTPLIVEGTGQRGNHISLTINSNIPKPNFNSKSITTKVDENGKWKTDRINLWLFENAKDARFTITARELDRTTRKNRISKKITVIPSINQNFPRHPVKPWGVSWSGIDHKVVSPLVIRGSAGKGRTVEIFISSHYTNSKGKKVDLPNIKTSTTSDNRGKWKKSIILPTPKTEKQLTHYVKVSQIGLGHQSGNASYTLTSDPNRVVAPTITQPKNLGSVKRHTFIKGTGVPNRYIKIRITENYHHSYDNKSWFVAKERVKVDSDGNWQTKVLDLGPISRPAPKHVFLIKATQVFPKYDSKKKESSSKYSAIRATAARSGLYE